MVPNYFYGAKRVGLAASNSLIHLWESFFYYMCYALVFELAQ